MGHSMAVAAFLPFVLVFSSASGSRRRLPNSRFMGELRLLRPWLGPAHSQSWRNAAARLPVQSLAVSAETAASVLC